MAMEHGWSRDFHGAIPSPRRCAISAEQGLPQTLYLPPELSSDRVSEIRVRPGQYQAQALTGGRESDRTSGVATVEGVA